MDDLLCRQFFLQPQRTNQRRYEALRAFFVQGQRLAEIADRLGYRVSALKSMVCRFRATCVRVDPPPFFFPTGVGDLLAGDAQKTARDPNPRPWRMSVS